MVDEAAKAATKENKPAAFVRELIEFVVVTLLLLVFIRWAFGETRSIPSGSMEPTLQIDDRLLVEKISGHFNQPYKRGEILVFYPPPSVMKGDLKNDPLTLLGRWTGLPCFPYETALIKRVIGLPGDTIVVQHDVGVFINGKLLDEDYIKERPNYDLRLMGDLRDGSPTAETLGGLKPEMPIIVPRGKMFMMGDNRNNSNDSHMWGFQDQQRVIGRACLLFWRPLWSRKVAGQQQP
ncbi:MAG TPA: signal peptidase I [Oculatellaceae cyanobacterium]